MANPCHTCWRIIRTAKVIKQSNFGEGRLRLQASSAGYRDVAERTNYNVSHLANEAAIRDFRIIGTTQGDRMCFHDDAVPEIPHILPILSELFI